MNWSAPIRVAVCIPTFRRPELLRRTLNALDRLEFVRMPQCQPTIVVVENEADGAAVEVCQACSGKYPLDYFVEPRPGVSYARNTAIQEAIGANDYIAFIDDDETPDPNWLDNLLAAIVEFKADAVCGPVLPVFEVIAPKWVDDGSFFERERFPTGSKLLEGRTGNVIIRSATLRRFEPPFDPSFSTSGAEDTHFFMRLLRSGGELVWADDAKVYESVSSDRTSLHWLLRRAYQGGNGFTFALLSIEPGWKSRLIRGVAGVARIGQGLATLPLALCRGRGSVVKALQAIYLGLGTLAGVAGSKVHAYHLTAEEGD